MSEFRRDPKGYYTMLGVSGEADAESIKSAFRSKAKRLHPDINPSPIAAKQFQRLSEAYEILSDPAKRTAYDKSTPASKSKAKAKTKTDPGPDAPGRRSRPRQKGRSTGRPTGRTDARTSAWTERSSKQENPKDTAKAKPDPAAQAASDDSINPEVCQCGKVTAQPRYVVFDMVSGQGTKLKRKALAGVFCRTCADRAALKASFITWIAGWWAWPNGPKETVKALWNNIRGGRKPADRNTRLLMHQAKAFRDRGEPALARCIAEQALVFARTPELRREVDTLLLSLSAHSATHLKTRWDKPGWSPMVKLAPFIALVVWASMSITMMTPVSLTDWVRSQVGGFTTQGDALKLAVGVRAEVITDVLNLRTGPGSNYNVVVILAKGTQVEITEVAPDGDWARVDAVRTEAGATGFVPLRALAPLPELK